MRLSQKLILFVLAAAIVPLALAGSWALHRAEVELGQRLEHEQSAVVAAAAETASSQLLGSVNAIAQSAALIDWRAATPQERQGGLDLLLGQAPLALAVAFVDPADPEAKLTRMAPDADARANASQATAPAADPAAEWKGLADALPLSTLGVYGDRGQTALGQSQASRLGPWMPIAVQVGPKGEKAPMIVAALALTPLDALLTRRAPEGLTLELVDADGRVVAASTPGARLAGQAPARWRFVQGGQPLGRTEANELLAWTQVPGRVGLDAVASVPMAVARAPVLAMRKTVLGGMALTAVFLVIAALIFVQSLTRRLDDVAQVAAEFARGQLSSRAKEEGQDELADLSRTFNQMGAELEVSRAKLLRWNDELRVKVDEATADLRAAQAQLLEAQKLAAIGQLGAGVAHEINNPLSGILGSAQLLLMDHPNGDPDFGLLAQIEESARRCRDITQNLLKFSQMRGEVSLGRVDLNAIVRAALEFEKPRHDEAKVTVSADFAPGELWIDGDSDALQQVIGQLCGNARTAMKDSAEKRLVVSTRATEQGPVLVVGDTGKGIPKENLDRIFEPFFTTKDVWTNVGLGLSVAYRLMQEHHGRMSVESEPGRGARFTLQFQPEGTVAAIKPKAEAAPLVVGGTGTGIVR